MIDIELLENSSFGLPTEILQIFPCQRLKKIENVSLFAGLAHTDELKFIFGGARVRGK